MKKQLDIGDTIRLRKLKLYKWYGSLIALPSMIPAKRLTVVEFTSVGNVLMSDGCYYNVYMLDMRTIRKHKGSEVDRENNNS